MTRRLAPLSGPQATEYAQFERRLRRRQLPELLIVYLLRLRELQLHAGVKQRTLARHAARIEGPPPPGRAQVGHTKTGEFSPRRLSAELSAQERLPRMALVQAIAELYAGATHVSASEVFADLSALAAAGENAAAAAAAQVKQDNLAAGRRYPTYAELSAEKQARVAAEQQHQQSQQRLAELQHSYSQLAAYRCPANRDRRPPGHVTAARSRPCSGAVPERRPNSHLARAAR